MFAWPRAFIVSRCLEPPCKHEVRVFEILLKGEWNLFGGGPTSRLVSMPLGTAKETDEIAPKKVVNYGKI